LLHTCIEEVVAHVLVSEDDGWVVVADGRGGEGVHVAPDGRPIFYSIKLVKMSYFNMLFFYIHI
jgi:hypothetical protein